MQKEIDHLVLETLNAKSAADAREFSQAALNLVTAAGILENTNRENLYLAHNLKNS